MSEKFFEIQDDIYEKSETYTIDNNFVLTADAIYKAIDDEIKKSGQSAIRYLSRDEVAEIYPDMRSNSKKDKYIRRYKRRGKK